MSFTYTFGQKLPNLVPQILVAIGYVVENWPSRFRTCIHYTNGLPVPGRRVQHSWIEKVSDPPSRVTLPPAQLNKFSTICFYFWLSTLLFKVTSPKVKHACYNKKVTKQNELSLFVEQKKLLPVAHSYIMYTQPRNLSISAQNAPTAITTRNVELSLFMFGFDNVRT